MTKPSEAAQHGPTSFDRLADRVGMLTSKAWFFAACLLLVILWAPSLIWVRDIDTWQLMINTPTTCITFLLVALQQNSQSRADSALQHKLNALTEGVADLLDHTDAGEAHELRAAVGLEDRESSR